jgi:hypothetical protein
MNSKSKMLNKILKTRKFINRNTFNLVVFLLIVSTFCFNILSCQSQKLPVREIIIERDGQTIVVVIAEIAVTQEERNKGLMYR